MATNGSAGIPRLREVGTAPCRLELGALRLPLEMVAPSSRCGSHAAAPWRGAHHRRGAAMTKKRRPVRRRARSGEGDQLTQLQRDTFRYFWRETNSENGLIADNTASPDIPASIAGVGFALASYPVAVERALVSRARAIERTLATLRFFRDAPHGPMPDATGHKGFFYHFLDVATGRRAWKCELSTIDTTILIAGALTAAAYFDRSRSEEHTS